MSKPATANRQRVNNSVRSEVLDLAMDFLICHDRGFGHDWDMLRWEDGPTIHRGRRLTIYVVHRISRCPRCTMIRKEIFEQINGELIKTDNRYSKVGGYSGSAGRMTQAEIRTALWLKGTTA
jgi:hypothetical protein